MTEQLDGLTREQLVTALHDAQAELRQYLSNLETDRLVHDLRVHQIELEMQNRELREAQAALEESRSRYADLYDLAPVAYCTTDRDGRITEVNLTATSWLGHDRMTLLGRPLAHFAVADDRVAVRNHLKRCMQERARLTTDVRLVVPALGNVVFQLSSTVMVGVDRQIAGCKTAITDISALKLSEQRLKLLADVSRLLSTSFDVDKNLAAMVQLLVPAYADLAFIDLFDPNGGARRVEVVAAEPVPQAVAETLRRPPIPRSTLKEALLLNDDRAHRALSHALSSSVTDQEAFLDACRAQSVLSVPLQQRGRALGALTFVCADPSRRLSQTDLTFAKDVASRAAMAVENAELYHAAERSKQTRQDILTMVSHELKNPLTAVTLSADVLLKSAPKDERRRTHRHVERIKRGAHHMRSMLDDLLDFAALETGRLSIEKHVVDVLAVVDDAVDLMAPLAQDKQLTLRHERGSAAVLASLCDKNRLLQVLSNLIGNAIKFTDQGEIVVSVEPMPAEDRVRVCVRDSGAGIPKQVLLHLFERYWQAKETASKGRGLGLFIARGIVEAQGGAIWVESHAGKGTSFFFTLPAAKTEDLGLSTSKGGTVLVVDDDADLRELLRDALEDAAYHVVVAADGKAALDYLAHGGPKPQVMLLDLLMPVMDGRELMAALKKDSMLSQIPVVLLSSVDNLAGEAGTLGARASLRKPVDLDRLLTLVAEASPGEARG